MGRVLCDNDYAGDPDGLQQLAHHVLSPSVDMVGVVASHLREGDPWNTSGRSAELGARKAARVLELAGRRDSPLHVGTERPLADRHTPRGSAGVRAILDAAAADDGRPLFVCLGGGLTELASAWLVEPGIAQRLTAVWVGGPEYPGFPPPPGGPSPEFNVTLDPMAAQVVVNDSDIPMWQVPRSTYRQALVSLAELQLSLVGPLGEHLLEQIMAVSAEVAGFGLNPGEAIVVGDSPLVLLTALQCAVDPAPSSSDFVDLPAPVMTSDGSPATEFDGRRTIRVCTRIDSSFMLRDLFAKLRLHAQA